MATTTTTQEEKVKDLATDWLITAAGFIAAKMLAGAFKNNPTLGAGAGLVLGGTLHWFSSHPMLKDFATGMLVQGTVGIIGSVWKNSGLSGAGDSPPALWVYSEPETVQANAAALQAMMSQVPPQPPKNWANEQAAPPLQLKTPPQEPMQPAVAQVVVGDRGMNDLVKAMRR